MTIDLCKVCEKQVNTRHHTIQCDICYSWIHKKCNKLNDIDYKQLQGSSVPWYCILCTSCIFPYGNLTNEQFSLILHTDANVCLDNIPPNLNLFPPTNRYNFFCNLNDFMSTRNLNETNDDENLSSTPSINCNYYDIDEFCSSNFDKNSFSILHLNIASLSAHFDELNTMLSLLNFEFNIIGVTETRIINNFSPPININIEGYVIEHTPTDASCGGALLYISNKLNYKPRKDLLMLKSKQLESIFIEIIIPKKENIIVGCIYRHPCMSINEFNDYYLLPLLQKLSYENKSIFLTGDFNINLLKCDSDDDTSEYFNSLTSNNLLPHITLPTRITDRSSTLIDNIFSNATNSNIFSGNITTSISDHLPQFLIHPGMNETFIPRKQNVFRRDTKRFNKENFSQEFLEINWNTIIEADKDDTNSAFSSFFSKFNSLLNKHMPLKKVSNKTFKRQFKPWITKAILVSIRKRNKFKQKFINAKNPARKKHFDTRFKTYRNLLVTLIRQSKKNHFASFFKNNSNNIRETWKGIKNLINFRNNNSFLPTCISDKNSTITDPQKICNKFNLFFTSIAGDLQKNIHSAHTDFRKYLKFPNLHSMFLFPTSINKISYLISKLSPSKASGPNSIPTTVLLLLNNDISAVFAKLFNLSFKTGTFPEILKLALVIPIFKKGSRLDCNNYRPISLLSNISKLIEKIMYSRLYSFLNAYNCLYDLQFGFRAKYSTSHALVSITEKIREALDTGHFACGIFIDLQKAFDTVDHGILLEKLNYYGIRGTPNNWFKSYLCDRKQYVSIYGFNSPLKSIKYGVPQGSVLGPLLFLIYINDLHMSINHSTVHHFADDTNLLHINKSLKNMGSKINSDLKRLVDWLNGNRLSLNVSKTEFIIFRHPNKKIHFDLKIRINGKRLVPSNHIKYLGLLIDDHLSWKAHINDLSNKLSRANSMLAKIRYYVDKTTLRSIYFAIFSSHLTYSCIVWGQSGNPRLKRICSLQRISARILCFAPFRSPTDSLFPRLNILKFSDLITIINCLFVFDFIKNNLPLSLSLVNAQGISLISLECNTRNCYTTHSSITTKKTCSSSLQVLFTYLYYIYIY